MSAFHDSACPVCQRDRAQCECPSGITLRTAAEIEAERLATKRKVHSDADFVARLVIEVMRGLPPEARKDVFETIEFNDQFCPHCGCNGPAVQCHCRNDE